MAQDDSECRPRSHKQYIRDCLIWHFFRNWSLAGTVESLTFLLKSRQMIQNEKQWNGIYEVRIPFCSVY